jgi:fimbrial chaperone protein
MNRLCILPLFAALVLAPAAGLAFELNPISREFAPAGSGATQTYEVVNSDKEPVAINVTVVTRALDSEGRETNASAEDDFLVYPSQFVVAPGARQSIRVSWLGNPSPERELAYRLVVEQLPIERFKAKPAAGTPAAGAITVLKRYMGSLYVRPAKARSDLVVESSRVERGPAGQPSQLVVLLQNRGTAHGVLKEHVLQVKQAGNAPQVSLLPESLPLKASVVLANGKTLLRFPWPQGSEPAAVTVAPRPRG